jgi:hypothetical protein
MKLFCGVGEVKSGMRFADRTMKNEEGDSVRTLVVMKVHQGGAEYQTHHPQLVYVECGSLWADGRVGRCWIALHRLLTNDYKLIAS